MNARLLTFDRADYRLTKVLMILVAVGAIGLVPADELAESEAPLADALQNGAGLDWAAAILARLSARCRPSVSTAR